MDKAKTIAALFDFDGVVMDTETQYSLFWSEQGHKYHPEIEGFERLIKGQTLSQLFGKYFLGKERIQQTIREELNEFERVMAYEYVPGIMNFIKELHSKNVMTAIVTSSNKAKMAHVYRLHPNIKEQFDCIIAADDFVQSKPNPECFLLGASKLGANPENSFVFEDSFHGLEAGRRAGMTVIGLSTTNPYDAIQNKADLVIPDFMEFTYDKMMDVNLAL